MPNFNGGLMKPPELHIYTSSYNACYIKYEMMRNNDFHSDMKPWIKIAEAI